MWSQNTWYMQDLSLGVFCELGSLLFTTRVQRSGDWVGKLGNAGLHE